MNRTVSQRPFYSCFALNYTCSSDRALCSSCEACCHSNLTDNGCISCVADHCGEAADEGSDIIMSLIRVLGKLVFIMFIAHVIMRRDETTLKRIRPGLGLLIQLSFPPLLFKALFEINLGKVQWPLIFAVFMAKMIMWVVGFLMGLLTSQRDFGIAGLCAMFMTLGNDIAFGVPLMKGLFPTEPQFANYDLLMCSVSEIFFNPLAYVCFEIHHAYAHNRRVKLKRKRGVAKAAAAAADTNAIFNEGEDEENDKEVVEKISWLKIMRNVFEEPMVIFALLGLLVNLIFNLGLGAHLRPTAGCPL
jgi:predicted permease